MRVAEGEHELLELGVGEGDLTVVVERSLEGGRSALALVGAGQGIEGGQVVELSDLGLVERSLERAVREGGGEVPAMIRTVQPEFLPPDPHAEASPPAQLASRPVFLPPNATHPAPAEAQNNRAVASLIFGSGSLGLLFFSAGVLFFLTLPGSVVAWILGNRAKRLGTARDQANVAVIIAIAGVVLGVIAGAVWIILVATGEYSTTTHVDHTQDRGLRFDVIRLVLPGI